MLVLAVFSAVIATVGAFVAFLDVDTDAVLLFVSIRTDTAAILLNESTLAPASGIALVLILNSITFDNGLFMTLLIRYLHVSMA